MERKIDGIDDNKLIQGNEDVSFVKDYGLLITGVLTTVKLFLASMNIDIVSDENISTFVNMIIAIATVYTIYKNNYVSKKGKAQKRALIEQGLDK